MSDGMSLEGKGGGALPSPLFESFAMRVNASIIASGISTAHYCNYPHERVLISC